MVDAGSVLAGRYRLEQRVASGGMGEVWRAFDRVLGRTVAVKRMRFAATDEPSFIDRFRAEARTMATVSHPGVVEIYDFGDDPATGMYLVMKYIEGESLSRTLARAGRLSPDTTMRLVAEAAEALHAAHRMGVTHRDVKPGNLLMRPDGSAMLTDFGIARTDATTGHTGPGSLIGTAGYFAPERAMGQPATARSDIYSLGIVAYQCLAGRLPFAGDSLVEVALRHAHEEPLPLPADVPPRVRALVERAMAKDPAARWPSGADLAAEARDAMTPAAPAPVAPKRGIGVAAVVTQRQAAALPPTVGQHSAGGRHGRRLLLPAAVLLTAIVATVAIILADGGGRPPSDLLANPGTTSSAGNVGATASATSGPTAVGTSPKASIGPSPAMPKNLTATPVGSNTIRLQWTDSSSDEEGFTITDGITERNVTANTSAYD